MSAPVKDYPKLHLPESMKGLTAKPKLHLYTAATPNGYKVSILLEELVRAYPELAKTTLSYDYSYIDMDRNDQKTPQFLAINPNGRIPALVDDNVQVNGKGNNLYETASIMLWLVEQYDKDNKFWFSDKVERSQALNVIFFTQAGVGPMQGQANHFFRYAPTYIEYGINRYQNETARLYSVLEDILNQGKGEWLVGDKYSIVDMNAFGWVRRAAWAGVDLSKFPKVSAWVDRIHQRPGALAGLEVPQHSNIGMSDEEKEKEAQRIKQFKETGKKP